MSVRTARNAHIKIVSKPKRGASGSTARSYGDSRRRSPLFWFKSSLSFSLAVMNSLVLTFRGAEGERRQENGAANKR